MKSIEDEYGVLLEDEIYECMNNINVRIIALNKILKAIENISELDVIDCNQNSIN